MLSIKSSYKSVNFVTLTILALLLMFCVTSCASNSDAIREETKGWSVQQLYTEASKALAKKSYTRAIALYQVLQSTYPYGIYAQQGLLDLAYTYYKDDKPEMALATIDQFITVYPTNPNMDYALYLKGYINYNNDNGLFANFTRQDLSERDPKTLQESYKAFYELSTNYPQSRFAADATKKANILVNALARGELYRSRYYMSVKAYLAAISRAQNVILNYAHTRYVEEALAIQVVAYSNLHEPKLSQDAQAVLNLSFPHSWYTTHTWSYSDISWYAFWRTDIESK